MGTVRSMAETSKSSTSKSTSTTAAGTAASPGVEPDGAAKGGVELGPQKDRVAAAGRRQDPYTEWDDVDLRRELIARGMTVAEQDRDSMIKSLEAYDTHGTQGADAPTGNHPETLRRHADEEAERQRKAHE